MGADSANRWYYELQTILDSLQKFPNRGLIAPEAEVFDREVRQIWVGKRRIYRLLYVVERGVVGILHVRHSRQPPLSEDPTN